MNENWVTSIGLDIGTSTTKFIVSRLLVNETKNRFSLPGVQIVDRQISYTSEIYTTPLKEENAIDVEALSLILAAEYKRSSVKLGDVKAGAVIITGETARKENAEAIIHYLAEKAGNFVIATAGNDLEGILAGKGSGAQKRSNEMDGIIANVDIGGGTANVALFQHGKAIQTCTFHVGGRLIRLSESGLVTYISPHIQPWLTAHHMMIKKGQTASYRQLYAIGEKMSEAMLSFLTGKPALHAELLQTAPLKKPMEPVQEIMFSGGVAHMMEQPRPITLGDAARHGDMGPLLAYALREAAVFYPAEVKAAQETTRATVIGAGMQNTEVSGATVFVDEAVLPLKNVPIVKVTVEQDEIWDADLFEKRVKQAIQQAVCLYEGNQPFAIALSHISYCTYAMLTAIAEAIQKAFDRHCTESKQIVVICESDMAKALGQALAKQGPPDRKIICLDQIDFTHGDYIDLGLPVAGEAIAVSVKTLAFS